MDVSDVRLLLRQEVDKAPRIADWAKEHDVSAGYVFDVLKGARPPGDKILSALGLEKVVMFQKIKP